MKSLNCVQPLWGPLNKMPFSRAGNVAGVALLMITGASAGAKRAVTGNKPHEMCRRVVLEGAVKAGQGFEKEFAGGLKFLLEPIASGWIVRVLPAHVPRGPHDYAELATPPYQSVTPLAISTDFSFRAQDAVGWNPRRFRYAQTAAVADRLTALYPGVMTNDAKASGEASTLVSQQPEAELEILNAVMVPGTADQWRMASAVALHFATTPHEVEQGAQPSLLGKLDELQFRVRLDVPGGFPLAPGVHAEAIPCATKPTL